MHTLEKIVPMALAVFVVSTAVADTAEEGKHKRRGPPAVAFEACAAAIDGDACAFDGRHGDALSGICLTGREQELVCRPDGAPPRLRRKDPDDRYEDAIESE
jgi:hypothetical protein